MNHPLETVLEPKAETKTHRIALVGNPNTGKTTLFNALTGLNQKVGNYPGVTVEKKIGFFKLEDRKVEVVDLPGSYSLAARSLDELCVTNLLLGKQPGEPPVELIVAIVDASNIQRNFYLLSQLIELGHPVVIALNMIDLAKSNGIEIDCKGLTRKLGFPVIPVCASKGQGVRELKHAIETGLWDNIYQALDQPVYPDSVNHALENLQTWIGTTHSDLKETITKPELIRALMDINGCTESRLNQVLDASFQERLQSERHAIAGDLPISSIEAQSRYGWINQTLNGFIRHPQTSTVSMSDTIDRVLTHKFFGFIIFFAVMIVVFQSIYTWAAPLMDWIDGLFGGLGEWATSVIPEGTLQSLVVDGIIAGVGGVVIFLPQIVILFAFIAILEDCGYMPRAAFLMDKVLSKIGLSGKSFIPMLSSFACAIPGVMATRTIEDRRDRITTILVAPLMSCSARLPVYVIFIAVFVPSTPVLGPWLNMQGLTLFCMYLLGISLAVPIAWILKKTLFKGEASTFLMELPSYKWPRPKNIAIYVYERAQAFLYRAGTVIFCVTVVVWALAYFPRSQETLERYESQRQTAQTELASDIKPAAISFDSERYSSSMTDKELIEQLESDERLQAEESQGISDSLLQPWNEYQEQMASIDRQENGDLLRQSFLGRMGRMVEPIVEPLGWDWRIGMATLASFPAREIIVATLGIILNMGSDVDEESTSLRTAIRETKRPDGEPLFNLPIALSIMVFFALCSQCAATLATIYRETNSWKWPVFTFSYMTGLAYVAAFITYHAAVFVGLG